jgi:hypothetical protein
MKRGILLIAWFLFPAMAGANEGHNVLMSMKPDQRTRALGQTLNASGKACTATTSFFQGFDRDRAAYWNVACSNGVAYNIQITDDKEGKTRILECSIMKAIGVECFKKLK